MTVPDGSFVGCKEIIVPEINTQPMFESDIEVEDAYYLDEILET